MYEVVLRLLSASHFLIVLLLDYPIDALIAALKSMKLSTILYTSTCIEYKTNLYHTLLKTKQGNKSLAWGGYLLLR